MSAGTIRTLQTVRFMNVQADQDAAREQKQEALTKQKDQIAETFDNRIEAVEEMKDARKGMGLATIIGTIVGGPLIGTLIGKGIGALATSGDKRAMNDANMDAGLSEVDRSRAQDDFAKAAEDFDSAQGEQDQLEKFSKELRRAERSLGSETY